MIKKYFKGFEIYKKDEGIQGVLYCRDINKKDWYSIVKEEKLQENEIAVLIYKNEIVDISNDLSVFFPADQFEIIILDKKYEWIKRNVKISKTQKEIYFVEDLSEVRE